MKEFFNRKRSVTMLIGSAFGIFFGIFAWIFNSSAFVCGVLLNLSAGAFEVVFIASVIDFWNERAIAKKTRVARELAFDNIDMIDFILALRLAHTFSPPLPSPSDRDAESYNNYKRYADDDPRVYIEGIDFKNFELNLDEGQTDSYFQTLSDIKRRLDELLAMFAFILDDELRGILLKFRQRLDQFLKNTHNKNWNFIQPVRMKLIKDSASWIFDDMSALHQFVKAH